MSKYVKDLLAQELKGRYDGVDSVLWIDLTGADGIVTNEFRRDLHGRSMRAEIVKNSVFRRACGEGPLSRLAEAIDGPTMLVHGGDSLVEVAKTIEQWAEKIPSLKMKGAVLEGEFLDEQTVTNLSKMPTKADMQARVVGIIRSPGANLAAAILSGGSRIAGCLKAMIEKLEKGESAAGSAATAEAPAPAAAEATAEAPAAEAPAAGEAPPVGEAPGEGG